MVSENVPIIGQGIYAILANDAGVSALVGTNIYPMIAPENTDLPYIIYEDRNVEPIVTKQGSFERDYVELFVYCCGNSYTNSKLLAREVKQALNYYSGTPVAGVTFGKIKYMESLKPELEERITAYMDKQVYRLFLDKTN